MVEATKSWKMMTRETYLSARSSNTFQLYQGAKCAFSWGQMRFYFIKSTVMLPKYGASTQKKEKHCQMRIIVNQTVPIFLLFIDFLVCIFSQHYHFKNKNCTSLPPSSSSEKSCLTWRLVNTNDTVCMPGTKCSSECCWKLNLIKKHPNEDFGWAVLPADDLRELVNCQNLSSLDALQNSVRRGSFQLRDSHYFCHFLRDVHQKYSQEVGPRSFKCLRNDDLLFIGAVTL